ncbi:MAG TPA: radical SAM/SPASM domain-containing protein [Candidatus Sumerlaeota bacterium]|nr:radical SAM/SPASM domain-containing protein [Candidatus Sumerlaeota bacterium]
MLHGWNYLTADDREQILRGIADGEVYGGPYHIELDWVDKCNARCFFCNSEYLQNGQSVPLDAAVGWVDEACAAGLRSMRFSGGGEPTLHPQFPEMLELLAARGIVLDNLNTNGTNLTDRAIAALVRVPKNEIRISLNYPNAATYAEGMGLPAKFFDRTLENIHKLNAARRGAESPGRLGLQFFIYKPTMHLIRECYELGRDLGADQIIFRELWDIDPALYCTPEDVPLILDQLRDVLRADWATGAVESLLDSHGLMGRVARLYEELHAELGGRPPRAPRAIDASNRYCYIGWYSMTIVGNKAVYPCCFLLPNKSIPALDSLEGKTLGQVWRGDGYRRFRKEMRDYFLLQSRIPWFDKRTRTISSACASHGECGFIPSLSDDAFYEEAERRLQAVRRRPAVRLWRGANQFGQALERATSSAQR